MITVRHSAFAALAVMVVLLTGTVHSVATDNQAPSFDTAKPGYRYEFPKDHGAHERFRTEWWYYTGQRR